MAQKRFFGVPLSEHAKGELGAVRDLYYIVGLGMVGVTSFFMVFLGFVIFVAAEPRGAGYWRNFLMVLLAGGGALMVTVLISWFLYQSRGRPRKQKIYEDNAEDYARAECLKTQIFPRFSGTRSDEFPLKETELPGSWRAFKVEHFASQSLRGDITGKVCLDIRSFFTGNAQISAGLKQLAVPDLLDMSSVVFFENEHGETLRVLVPSPRATKETLARLIEFYIGKKQYGHYDGGVLSYGTHVHKALRQFTADESSLLSPISHPALLDRLDAAAQKPTAAKPAVTVIGEMVQNGVALATALVVDGVKKIFFPSGYLGEFASGIAFTLDTYQKPSNLLEAVR
ncbi:MAG: hypothetical protein HY481_00380 [Candidatus Vogelbacteria bacterium]|nr:hypothetical protein [Candidatus Vogelbacteria bacterium]